MNTWAWAGRPGATQCSSPPSTKCSPRTQIMTSSVLSPKRSSSASRTIFCAKFSKEIPTGSPLEGVVLYNNNTFDYYFYDGLMWRRPSWAFGVTMVTRRAEDLSPTGPGWKGLLALLGLQVHPPWQNCKQNHLWTLLLIKVWNLVLNQFPDGGIRKLRHLCWNINCKIADGRITNRKPRNV